MQGQVLQPQEAPASGCDEAPESGRAAGQDRKVGQGEATRTRRRRHRPRRRDHAAQGANRVHAENNHRKK